MPCLWWTNLSRRSEVGISGGPTVSRWLRSPSPHTIPAAARARCKRSTGRSWPAHARRWDRIAVSGIAQGWQPPAIKTTHRHSLNQDTTTGDLLADSWPVSADDCAESVFSVQTVPRGSCTRASGRAFGHCRRSVANVAGAKRGRRGFTCWRSGSRRESAPPSRDKIVPPPSPTLQSPPGPFPRAWLGASFGAGRRPARRWP